jgi:hypothetical protein
VVPTLHIDKEEPGLYTARVCDGNAEISEPTTHHAIADALKFAGSDVPEELAHFIEVWYIDVSIGMHTLVKLRTESEAMASELVALAAAVWQSEEKLQRR